MNYITLKDMGSSGGLCSQLQIYASLLAVAEHNNMDVVFSKKMIEGKQTMHHPTQELIQTNIRIFDSFELDDTFSIKEEEFFSDFINKDINFHTTTYDTTLFPLSPKGNYNLVGRFDLYTYWYNTIGDKIAKWEFKNHLKTQAIERMNQIKSQLGDKPTVSIHVRRGDYLLPQYAFCPLDRDFNYYIKAITEYFNPIEDYNFIVFSNDINYTKRMFGGDNIFFVEPIGGEKVCTDSEKEDLALLSLCDHHIIANSSYSWWGAYLSKNLNKKIICPTYWLHPQHESSWINGNYYPPNWNNIDNIT